MFFSQKYKDALLKIQTILIGDPECPTNGPSIEERLKKVETIAVRSHEKVEQNAFRLTQIEEQLAKIMANQQDLDNLVASENADLSAIGTDLTNIASAVATVSAEVQAIINSAPAGLDLSKLQTAQQDLDAKASALGSVAASIAAIVPATPTDGGTPAS